MAHNKFTIIENFYGHVNNISYLNLLLAYRIYQITVY